MPGGWWTGSARSRSAAFFRKLGIGKRKSEIEISVRIVVCPAVEHVCQAVVQTGADGNDVCIPLTGSIENYANVLLGSKNIQSRASAPGPRRQDRTSLCRP